MLSSIVKISSVTNLSDARYCAGMGVEMIGFSVDPESDDYVDSAKFNEISSWVSGVKLVGETKSEDPQTIIGLLRDYRLDALEVRNPALLPYLKSELSLPLLLAVETKGLLPEGLDALLRRYHTDVAYFVLEGNAGQPLTPPWIQFLKKLESPVLLGFGFESGEEIRTLADTLPLKGFSLKGSREIRPGFKDYGILMDLLEALEEND